MSAPAQPKPDPRSLSEGSDIGAAGARLVDACLALSRLLAFLALFTGLLGFVGWILHVPIFTAPNPFANQPNTALGLVLGAAVVLLSARDGHGRSAARSLLVCCLAAIVLVFGLLTASEYVIGLDLGVDRLFVGTPPTPADPYPGRPSPQAAAGLALLGACLLWFELSPRRFILVGQIGAVLVAADAVIALTGYVFGVSALYLFPVRGTFMVMSIPAALGFVMISTALLCRRPDEGMMSLITSGSRSGAIARRIVLFLVLGPPLVALLTLIGVNAGWYDRSIQASLFALIMLSLLLWNTWQAARQGERGELLAQAANAAVKRSEAKFSGIVSISADAIIQIDENQKIVMFNRGAEKIFEYAAGEVLGRRLDILIPERVRAIHGRHVAEFASGPDVSRSIGGRGAPIFGLRKGGREFPADAAISKLTIGNDKILVAAVRDSTKQKRAEAEQRFLAEAGAVLAAALDYEDALERIADLAIRDVADACMIDILGPDNELCRRKVVSHDPSKTAACETLARAPIDASYLAATISEKREVVLLPDVSPNAVRFLARGEAAREAWLELEPRSMITIPVTARGRLAAVISLISSTPSTFSATDRSFAEELAYRTATAIENILLYRDLRRAVRVREDVLAIVSHDLRNPLTVISSVAGLLGSAEMLTKEKLEKYASAIRLSADQMKRLIGDLLDFSMMQSGAFTIRKLTERPADLIAEIVDSMRNQAEARGLTLTTHAAGDLPEVECDRRRVGQALSNLLANAMKFTPEGGVISISARVAADEFVLTVSDTGPGIPAEHLPRIFDRYWQAEEAKNMGAGLGLAIVRGIAEAHGGRTWAESRLGVGSSFHLALPLNRR